MTVSIQACNQALQGGFFETDTLHDSQMNNGLMHNKQIDANDKGVIGTIQVGEDAPFEDIAAVIVGQYIRGRPNHPRPSGGEEVAAQTLKAKPEFELQTDGDADVNADTAVSLAAGKESTDTKPSVMPPRRERLNNTTDQSATDIEPLVPSLRRPTYIREGQYLNVVGHAGNSAQTFGFDHATIEIPLLTWDRSGL